ncbi:hypothetical protein [Amycolatopsis lexingtonensis]|uniref:hypothetical protein n=1 Tax=Amycolatopsis lexingtonensis TaxID=218822 RepID=UPI003F72E559
MTTKGWAFPARIRSSAKRSTALLRHLASYGFVVAAVVYGELAGATHFTAAGDGGGFRGAITAWSKVLRNELALQV